MWDYLERILAERDGLVDCHRHVASEHTIDAPSYSAISDGRHLDKKWALMDRVRKDPLYLQDLSLRLRSVFEHLRGQGIAFCRTYAEIDATLGTSVVRELVEAKRGWGAAGIYLQVAAYPFSGIAARVQLRRTEEGLEMADLLGCLPSRGRRDETDGATSHRNMRALFALAHKYQKPIDLQIDQNNSWLENESALLVDVTAEFRDKGYAESVTATHCISLGAQNPRERERVIRHFADLDIRVVVCPSAALGMKQPSHLTTSTRNSIAPVHELLDAGVMVGIGCDNVADIYEPWGTGSIREEMRALISAVRWTDSPGTIADIMTTNGRKILGI